MYTFQTLAFIVEEKRNSSEKQMKVPSRVRRSLKELEIAQLASSNPW